MERTTFTLDPETKTLLKLIAEQIAANNASFVIRKLVHEKAQALGLITTPAPRTKKAAAKSVATATTN